MESRLWLGEKSGTRRMHERQEGHRYLIFLGEATQSMLRTSRRQPFPRHQHTADDKYTINPQ